MLTESDEQYGDKYLNIFATNLHKKSHLWKLSRTQPTKSCNSVTQRNPVQPNPTHERNRPTSNCGLAAYVSRFDGMLGDMVTSAPSLFRRVITADLSHNDTGARLHQR